MKATTIAIGTAWSRPGCCRVECTPGRERRIPFSGSAHASSREGDHAPYLTAAFAFYSTSHFGMFARSSPITTQPWNSWLRSRHQCEWRRPDCLG